MTMPYQLKPFISERDWRRLALHELPSGSRQDVVEVLLATLEHENPKTLRDESIDNLLDFAQLYADNLRGAANIDWRGLDAEDVEGGAALSEYIGRQDSKIDDEVAAEEKRLVEEKEREKELRRQKRHPK